MNQPKLKKKQLKDPKLFLFFKETLNGRLQGF